MKKIPIIILAAVTLLSCKTLITDDFPDFESLPTVNSILVVGKPLSVQVSLTGGIDSLPLSTVSNAEIELYIDGKFVEQLKNSGDGTYISTSTVEAGKEYKCKAIIPNQDTIVCSQTLPEASQILNVEHISIAGRDEEGISYPAIKVTFKNSVLDRKYFEIKITCYANYAGWQEEDSLVEDYTHIQYIIDPVLLNEGLPIVLFSNELIHDSTYTMTINYTNGESGGSKIKYRRPFVVQLRSVTYDYYRYQKQYYLYNEGKNADFMETATASPLYSNIENGYGIFAGYSVFATDTITPEAYED
jgi:hypothetical protein